MCRSGLWSSCRLCVLVPLFSSEQRLVSLVPLLAVSLPIPPSRTPTPQWYPTPQQAIPPAPVSPGPPPPLQTVEPKLAQLSVAGEAFGSKCEGGGWDGQGKNLGGNLGCCGQRPLWKMSQPKGIILSGVKEGLRNLQPRPGETQTGMSHLSFISQILETAVCIFGGGGFRAGKGSGDED